MKEIVLGLDPGIHTGYALLKNKKLIIYGEINLSKKAFMMSYLFEQINDLLILYKPSLCVIESIFANKLNFKTTLRLCEIRGVLLTCCEIQKIPYVCYAPCVIKKVICGYGKATKEDIKKQIIERYNIQIKSHNICDAIAIASTYFEHKPLI